MLAQKRIFNFEYMSLAHKHYIPRAANVSNKIMLNKYGHKKLFRLLVRAFRFVHFVRLIGN